MAVLARITPRKVPASQVVDGRAIEPNPAGEPQTDPSLDAFGAVVDRLQGVINHETECLSRSVPLDLGDMNRQKRQGMLELSRVMRSFAGRPAPKDVERRLATLNEALERNRAVLDVQLSAVREIAGIIAQVMRDAEWDGTYSMRAVRP